MSFAGRETVTVLVPAVSGPALGSRRQPASVSARWPGMRYLEDMARTVAVTLLTLTPENAGHVRLAAARLVPCLGARRGRRLGRGRGRPHGRAGTSPAPSIPPGGRSRPGAVSRVEIAGELVTWIGREEASREDRRYRLVFRIDAGRIGLLRFEQLESGK